MEVSRIFLPVPGIDALKAEATAIGFRFIDRLISEWESGLNTFNQDGEVLIGVHDDGNLVAVGGINQDPYAKDSAVGRIRHVYVLSRCRRQGIGRALVDSLLQETGGVFSEVRLRTDTAEAANFYEQCGFDRVSDDTATHRRKMVPSSQP